MTMLSLMQHKLMWMFYAQLDAASADILNSYKLYHKKINQKMNKY